MLEDNTRERIERLLAKASGSVEGAAAVAGHLAASVEGDRYRHGGRAVQRLVDGAMSIPGIDGERLAIDDVLRNLAATSVPPEQVASALVLACVAAGGAPDGVRPAWQHMADTREVAKSLGVAPSHPVRGIPNPGAARTAYCRAIGDRTLSGKAATAARGPADRHER